MSRWFRLYDEMLDDPKVQMLSPELFRTWVNLLCLASRNKGRLPPTRQAAFALRMSCDDLQSRLDDLILAGLIDIGADKGLSPHNWSKRQWASDDSSERVRRHRAAKRQRLETPDETDNAPGDVTHVTVTVTPPDTDTETDTETESKSPLTPQTGGDSQPEPIEAKRAGPTPMEALRAFESYNAVALRCGLQQASKLTGDRQRKIVARLRDYGLDGWERAMANIERSGFLTGKNDKGWRANLDFVVQASSFGKLHDGAYGNGQQAEARGKAEPRPAWDMPTRRRDDGLTEEWKRQVAREFGYTVGGRQ